MAYGTQMKCLYSRSYSVTTYNAGPNRISCRTVFLDNRVEKTASILVNTTDSTIVSADLTTLRGLNLAENNSTQSFSELAGVSLYDRFTRALNHATQNDATGYHNSILLETVRGVITSRGSYSKEAGFATLEDYDEHWAKTHKDSCAYFSNLDKLEKPFRDYFGQLGCESRSEQQLSRVKNYYVYQLGNELLCWASLMDTFHQIELAVRLDPKSMLIVDASGEVVRSPDVVCRQANQVLSDLRGVSFESKRESVRAVRKLVSTGKGCFHMGDMAVELLNCVDLVMNQMN